MTQIIKHGNSVGITIPKHIKDVMDVEWGNNVHVVIDCEENNLKNRDILLVKLAWKSKKEILNR